MLEVPMSPNMHGLSDDNLPAELTMFDRTPQRTNEWWARRRHKASGSKLSQLLFIDTAQELATYRDEVFGNRPRPPLDEEAKKRVQWGVDHEEDACATLLHHIDGLKVWDVGFEMHPRHTWFGSSPDGIVHWPEKFPDDPWGVLEIKCSTKTTTGKKGSKSVPHAGVPAYYIPQLHAEMSVVPLPRRANWCVFVSWSGSTSKIYVVRFNETYWNLLWEMVVDFKLGDIPFDHWMRKKMVLKKASEEIARSAEHIATVQSCCVKKE